MSAAFDIWIYKRECQLGDYVYADGSFSDKLQNDKTVIGICFYINKDDPSKRYCVSLEDISIKREWGLYSENWAGGITLDTDPSYSVFDLQALTNKSYQFARITAAEFRDESSLGDNGFKIFAATTQLGEIGWTDCDINWFDYKIGNKIPWGQLNTLKIIQHRNRILSEINPPLPIPSSNLELLEYMSKVVTDNGNNTNYRQYYYPAASLCYAFEPGTTKGDILADKFKAGRWWLPSTGELARLYWYHNQGYDNASEDAIFSRAATEGVLKKFQSAYYWSSTEASSTNAQNIGFDYGYLYQNTVDRRKNLTYTIRPICAF